MPCYSPLQAYRCPQTGTVSFSRKHSNDGSLINLPCGQCIGCRLERTRQWAVRIQHEAELHEHSSFVTLTYDDEHLPPFGNLQYHDVQKFLKRLRKHTGTKIRYYLCGEYGDLNRRPHYHLILFGESFTADRYIWRDTQRHKLYRSPTLEKLWPLGQSSIGDVTNESASYTARYCTKKITGHKAADHYRVTDPVTGETTQLCPEFARMSLKPAIATDWLRLYWTDIQDGTVVINGHKSIAPKRYRNYLKKTIHKDTIDETLQAMSRPEDQTPERIKVREAVAKARLNLKKREL